MSHDKFSTNIKPTMCIFCLKSSIGSKSIEHIVPESLGNTQATLPTGMVCDSCNNYFGRKLEGKLLNTPYFKSLRFRNNIPTKRNRPTSQVGLIPNARMKVNCYTHPDHGFSIGPFIESDSKALIDFFKTNTTGKLYIPYETPLPDKHLTSRFLAKAALEAAALRLYPDPAWQEFIFQDQLNELRTYARYGGRGPVWEHSIRRIYNEDFVFSKKEEHYQILHEYDFLWTKRNELYFVFCLFGVEYTINLGGNSIDGYKEWLKENNNLSPLQSKSNKNE